MSFLIGRDHDGRWIVREDRGRYGGLFTSASAAARYARFEAANRRAVIRYVAEPLEFAWTAGAVGGRAITPCR